MYMDINLNNLICDTFVDAFKNIVNCDVDRAILKGGRSTTKSQTVSEAIVVGCMVYRESAVAAVKYANKIEERLVNTFRDSIRYLGVERMWKLRKSPFEYVLLDNDGKETDVSIKFTGCDNPDTIKSFKPRRGGFRYVWFEEVTNFLSIKEINSLIQTFARGKGKHVVIMTYNPPMETSNWVNKEYNVPIGKILGYDSNYSYSEFEFEVGGQVKKIRQLVHHSTYFDVVEAGHADWLGDTVIGEAEKSAVENPKYYRWAWLGEVVGTDANVFINIRDWDGDTSKLDIREVFRGFDWGYGGPDPCAYTAWYYDRKNKYIYALDEFCKAKMDIDDVVYEIKHLNKHNFPVFSDSASPILNNQLRNKGLNIADVKKGPDSVRAGIKWLQGLNAIYICKFKTPSVYKEFTEYEYVVDREDNVTSKLIDKNNHTIDSTRYGFSLEIKYD